MALPLLALLCPGAAQAQVGSDRFSSIVVNAASGTVLASVYPDALRHPASLAKLMTLYMAFGALRDRRITLNTTVPVSAHCASMEPTKLGLEPGMPFTVQQAILGMVTRSANDAACALGELLGGSEEQFAEMMTLRARALGMSRTTFTNASGLPAPDQWTTARDMAILARGLIRDFPEDYHYFSTPSFVFRGVTILNHDMMLKIYPGADGMKTGFTDASGHNLVTSAVRDGVRLIGVEMGAATNPECDTHMEAMLNASYAALDLPIGRPTEVASRVSLIGRAHAATLEHAIHASPVERVAAHVEAEERGRRGLPVARVDAGWAVQVGVYREERVAREAAFAAHRIADNGEPRVEPGTARGRRAWRAQLIGLTGPEAQGACSRLSHHRTPCMVLSPQTREVASR
ncbi:MAG TPA: D-alanyl-D-alanine carboxypeptidase family protein [Acetobacteraceae bacterium]|nr:D-alanyl-D-alanine carboxypeptidase family protein [Acetobacteraceae bacterium]